MASVMPAQLSSLVLERPFQRFATIRLEMTRAVGAKRRRLKGAGNRSTRRRTVNRPSL